MPFTTNINSVVTYVCDEGHRFNDGHRTTEITCIHDLVWSNEDVRHCEGK